MAAGRPTAKKYKPKSRNIVEPLRSEKDIQKLKEYLYYKNLRDYCFFVIGINTNLRACDILRLRYQQVYEAKEFNKPLVIYEKKTSKKRILSLNMSIKQALDIYFASRSFRGDELLFTREDGLQLSTSAVSKMIKRACQKVEIQGNYASHTMRKTWGYFQRTKLNTPLPVLVHMFNHRSQAMTLHYLCIQDEEAQQAYTSLNL